MNLGSPGLHADGGEITTRHNSPSFPFPEYVCSQSSYTASTSPPPAHPSPSPPLPPPHSTTPAFHHRLTLCTTLHRPSLMPPRTTLSHYLVSLTPSLHTPPPPTPAPPTPAPLSPPHPTPYFSTPALVLPSPPRPHPRFLFSSFFTFSF